MNAMLTEINAVPEDEKIIIFTQFHNLVDTISQELQKNDIMF
jgi:ERCC4-related helicase